MRWTASRGRGATSTRPPPCCIGRSPASRVGHDPYRSLARAHADRFDQAFLVAIDRALAFAPEQRPQLIDEWRRLFGNSLPTIGPAATDAPTQKMGAAEPGRPQGVRLGGVTRGLEVVPPAAPKPARRLPFGLLASVLAVAIAALAAWQLRPQIEALVADGSAPEPLPAATPITPAPTAPPTLAPVPVPAPAPTPTPSPTSPQADHKALVEQAQRAAAEAHALAGKVKDTTAAALSMAGEAKIAAARAGLATLENAERVNSEDGTSYVGQLVDGKREGLGIAHLKDGRSQAGEWKDNLLNGRGTGDDVDGAHFEGEWRNGRPNGVGVREKPGVERAEGNFSAGVLDGLGLRRTFGEPSTVQSGEWHAGMLDGLGVETVGDKQRYEGGFRAGKRHGFGQLTGPDEKVISGRWEDGKLVESAP